jgi:hypothetical protein
MALPSSHRPAALPVHFGLADPGELGPLVGAALGLLGVRPSSSGVWVDDDVVTATFGPWTLRTPTSNVASAEVTGPYEAWKAAGLRLSLADRGLTFGTTTRGGVCLSFHEPVPGIEPAGLLRHPSLTVTVSEPGLLVDRLREVGVTVSRGSHEIAARLERGGPTCAATPGSADRTPSHRSADR